jgi:PIN domain nuclease of toxin-antitoxin system
VNLLLDTQLAVWWQLGDPRLTPAIRQLVETSGERVCISRASLWELASKAGLGRLRLDLERFARSMDADGFEWLGIEEAHLLAVAALRPVPDHRDPFDRLLVAQSIAERMTLVTVDRALSQYGTTVSVM